VLDLTDAWLASEQHAVEQARRAVDPQSDLHATSDYRRHLAGVLTARAAKQAISGAADARTADARAAA
jgi:carbon-monoxide dehydrogenase medium subunit